MLLEAWSPIETSIVQRLWVPVRIKLLAQLTAEPTLVLRVAHRTSTVAHAVFFQKPDSLVDQFKCQSIQYVKCADIS